MTPILLVLLDGLGDQPHPDLGGRTTNEVAHTPNLDRFAQDSSCGVVSPVGRGGAASSEVAHWTYFTGSLASFPGRAVLEGLGHGHEVDDDTVVGYLALRSGERAHDGAVWLGSRPGGGDEQDARALLAALPPGPFHDLRFSVEPVAGGDALVVLKGGAHPAVSDTDSFEDDLHPLLECQALADDDGAVRTAAALNDWTIASHEVLRTHAVNRQRRTRGKPSFDVATSKWWGQRRDVVSFRARTGLVGAVVSSASYQGGIARLLGMEWVAPPPTNPGRDSLEARLRLVGDLLAAGFDFVHCHDKTADEAGHTKDPLRKVAALESLDAALALLPDPAADLVVMITGDHATPTTGRMLHSGDPVPLMMRGRRVAADAVTEFGEAHQARGALGHVNGSDLLPVALNAADRARFLGGHAGASAHAIGAAAAPPLRLPPGG